MDIREQRFGIEIELTGITRSSAARAVAGYFGTRSDHVGGGYDAYHIVDGEGRTWKVMSDSSLRAEKREDRHKRAASITTRSRWSAPSCATATSRRCRKSSAPFAARELSPTTAAASTSTSTPRHTRPRRCARSPTSWPARRTFSTAPSGLSGAASSHRYANRTPSKRCQRNAATSESRLSHRRETWDFDTDDTPRAPPPPRPCAWRCRARTSRPPRRRARTGGSPGTSCRTPAGRCTPRAPRARASSLPVRCIVQRP